MLRSHPPARRVARRIVPTLVLALFATALPAASSLLPAPAGSREVRLAGIGAAAIADVDEDED